MDLDTTQLRTFVAAAEHEHFGDAAAELLVSQQAVSKRIGRLEEALGEALFTRVGRGVALTGAGRRLLPFARELLAMASAAADAVRGVARTLRVDVWGSFFGPMRKLGNLARRTPELEVETTERWSLAGAVRALEHDEIDVAFGRVDAPTGWPDTLAHRPVLLERLAVALNDDHPLALAPRLHPSDLKEWELWWPIGEGPAEMVRFVDQFSATFDVAVDRRRYVTGPVSPVEVLLDDPHRVMAWGLDWPIAESGVRSIPLDPAPAYLWSMAWRAGDPHPLVALLHDLVVDTGRREGWLAVDPDHDWIPTTDLAALTAVDRPAGLSDGVVSVNPARRRTA